MRAMIPGIEATMGEWIKTQFKGIRYKEHPTKKHGIKFDRYFEARFQVAGKIKSRGLGWASEGWTLEKASAERLRLVELAKNEGLILSQKEERALREQIKNDEQSSLTETQNKFITIESIWERYLPFSQANKNKSSWRTENGYYQKWIKPIIGSRFISDVKPSELESIKQIMLQAGKAPRTVQYVLAIVRQIFNFASDNEFFTGENPSKKIKRPKFDNRRIAFFTHEQATQLLTRLSFRSQDLHDMTLISIRCGLRAGEIFDLTWQDIDLERELITIRDPKNHKNRTVPMFTSDVVNALKIKKATQDNNLVFPGRDGSKRKEISNLFERVINELGFNNDISDRRQKLTFHSLRHTCASWLVMSGVPLYTVKEILGHQSITMTERYSHLAPGAFDTAKKAMSDISLDTDPKHPS